MNDFTLTPVRFGLAGYGRVAPTHVGAMRALGNRVEFTAVCDPDPEARTRGLAAGAGSACASLTELLARSDIEVVSVCTPSGLHAAHGMAAARAGKHVLVEKPIDVRREAARELIDTCAKEGVKLFVVKQNRLNPTIRLLKEAVEKGRFGKIYSIQCVVVWKREQSYYDSAAWRGTREMDGGAFLNQGIHFIDAMRFVIGSEVTEVKSMLARLARKIECEDSGSALFRFENGVMGNIFVSMLGRNDREGSLTVLGERGCVRVGGVAMNRMEHWEFETPDPEADARAADADTEIASVYGRGHCSYYEQVVNHLRGGGPPPTGGEEAYRSLSLLLSIYDNAC